MQHGDKVYKLNMDMPWSAVLNFDSVRRGFERMFAMFNPYLQLPLIAVGLHTFPNVGFYEKSIFKGELKSSEEKADMPLSMFWAYEKLLNSPAFQRRTGLTWRAVQDDVVVLPATVPNVPAAIGNCDGAIVREVVPRHPGYLRVNLDRKDCLPV